jgi:hypothetical protein
MKLLVDTGAELCLLKHWSLKEGAVYNPSTTINVRGISNKTERTLGEVNAKLIVGNYETEHKFHVVGSGMNIPRDGILGNDFSESKRATIDYVRKEITMGKVALKFDDNKQTRVQNKEILVVLKPRSETIVKLPTKSDESETGLIDSTEIAPGIIIWRSLTVVRDKTCLTSIVNMNDTEIEVALPSIKLEHCETQPLNIGILNTQILKRSLSSPAMLVPAG